MMVDDSADEADTAFERLLLQLGEAHASEVGLLREEVCRLRSDSSCQETADFKRSESFQEPQTPPFISRCSLARKTAPANFSSSTTLTGSERSRSVRFRPVVSCASSGLSTASAASSSGDNQETADTPLSGPVASALEALEKAANYRSEESDDVSDKELSRISVVSRATNKLPFNWPASLPIRPELVCNGDLRRTSRSITQIHTRQMMGVLQRLESADVALPFMEARGCTLRALVLEPNSYFRLIFDLTSLLLLCYDLVVIPYALAWEIPFTGFLNIMTFVTVPFWTIDLLSKFFTGILHEGQLEMDPKVIAQHYLRTTFVPDFLIVFSDWMSFILTQVLNSTDASGVRMLRFAKFGRFLRILGVIRMMRFVSLFEDYVERSLSEQHRYMIKIFAFLFVTIWLNHCASCMWWSLGRTRLSDINWITHGSEDFGSMAAPAQYIAAFHWAVAQITLGATDIVSRNMFERLFSALCLLFGLIFSGTVVASFSANMVQYQINRRDQTTKLREVRRFLIENQIDRRLTPLIQQQIKMRLGVRERLRLQDVSALNLLSQTLRAALHFDIVRPHVAGHALWRMWHAVDVAAVERICGAAVETLFLRKMDDLFVPSSVAQCAYILLQGDLCYEEVPGSSMTTEAKSFLIHGPSSDDARKDRWLAEAALWSHWVHVGRAEGRSVCSLVIIQADSFVEALPKQGVIHDTAVEYAACFHKRLAASRPPNAPWPSDLHVQGTDFADLVSLMDLQVAALIGVQALQAYSARSARSSGAVHPSTFGHGIVHRLTTKTMRELRDEVYKGKSIMTVNGHGDLERMVKLVTLRLTKDDGSALVRVGHWRDNRLVSCCDLPGGSMQWEESIGDTVKRLLDGVLLPLASCIEFSRIEETRVEIKESRRHHLRTKYVYRECSARLTSDITAAVMQDRKKQHAPFRASSFANIPSIPLGRTLQHANSKLKVLQTSDVYIFNNDDADELEFYMWVPPEEYEYIKTQAGEAALHDWLSTLNCRSLFTTPQSTDRSSRGGRSSYAFTGASFGLAPGMFGPRSSRGEEPPRPRHLTSTHSVEMGSTAEERHQGTRLPSDDRSEATLASSTQSQASSKLCPPSPPSMPSSPKPSCSLPLFLFTKEDIDSLVDLPAEHHVVL